jgi:phosphatidylserine/phosphatidylglycerophosphate/cardiolipin synthase-like enzyme
MSQPSVSGFARLVAMAIVAIAVTLLYQHRREVPVSSFTPQPGKSEAASASDYFSPAQNLERLDIEQLNRAQRTIDIAMYAFTDRYLADQLIALARRGVVIRIYRDHQQFEEEQRGGGRRSSESSTQMFSGETNIHVRVKHSHDLMHLKAYLVDGAVLRDGSANWSPSGLKRQDNNAHFTTDPAQVHAFQNIFDEMWSRSDNEEIQ